MHLYATKSKNRSVGNSVHKKYEQLNTKESKFRVVSCSSLFDDKISKKKKAWCAMREEKLLKRK